MEFLFGFGLVVLMVMLIGHGLWELTAWFFRGFQPRRQKIVCVRCSAEIASYPCSRCGHGTPLVNKREIAREVLADLGLKGLIDEETRHKVEEALLKSGRAAAATPPVPVARRAEHQAPPVANRPTLQPQEAPEVPEAELAGAPQAAARPAAPARMAPPSRPAAAPMPAAPPRPPKKPARPFSEVLKGFMEERNIRWGELIGGMLIVGCSLALVVSLWSKIAEQPFLKVTVFTSVVAGLFGLGLYADRKWRLPTTSYSILLIALLMVPLHFAAMVVVGGQQAGLVLAAEAAGVLVLGALVYLASGVVAPRARVVVTSGLLVLSLVGPAMYLAGQMQQHGGIALRGGLIVSLLIAAALSLMVRMRRIADDSPAFAREFVSAFGVLAFAAVPSIAMHIAHGAGVPFFRQLIAPVLVLLAIPLVEAGFLLRERFPKRGGAWNTTGWGMSIAAAVLALAMVALCWPVPVSLTAAAVTAAVLMAAAGMWRGDRVAGIAAPIAVAIAYIAALAPVLGRMAWTDSTATLFEQAFSIHLALELLPLAGIVLAVGTLLWKRVPVATYTSFGIAGLSVLIALAHLFVSVYGRGIDLPEARWIFAALAAGAIAGGVAKRISPVVGTGSAFAVLTIERWFPGSWTWAAVSVGLAWSATTGAAFSVPPLHRVRQVAFKNAWGVLLFAGLLLASGLAGRSTQTSALLAWALAAGATLLLASMPRRAELAFAQLAIAAACALQAIATAHRQIPLDDPRIWIIASAVLVLLQGLWTAADRLMVRNGRFRGLLDWEMSPARVIGGLASTTIILFMGLWLAGAAGEEIFISQWHGVMSRLAPFWFLPILVAVVAVLEEAMSKRGWWVFAVLGIYLAAAGGLAQFMPDYIATSIRFSGLGVMAVLSAAILLRHRLGKLAPSLAPDGRTWMLLACGVVPLLVLTTLAAGSNLSNTGPRAPVAGTFLASIGAIGSYIVPLGIAALVFAAHAIARRSQAFAIIAIALIHYAVTLAFILEHGVGNNSDVLLLVRLNALVAGLCAWVWILVREFLLKDADEEPAGIAVVAGACLLGVIGTAVLLEPAVAIRFMGSVQTLRSGVDMFVAWAGIAIAASLLYRLVAQRRWPSAMFWVLLAITIISAETAQYALGYMAAVRTLLVGHTLSTAIIYFAGRWLADRGAMLAGSEAVVLDRQNPQLDSAGRVQLGYVTQRSSESAGIAGVAAATLMQRVRIWGILAAVLAFLLATFDMAVDPQRPWWTVGALVTLASLALVIAQRELRPTYLYYSAIATCFAASFLWGSHFWIFTGHSVRDLAMLNLVILAGMGLISVILERQIFTPSAESVVRRLPRLHVLLSVFGVAVLFGTALLQLLSPSLYQTQSSLLLGLGACAAVIALCVGRLWDTRRVGEISVLYSATLATLLMIVGLGEMDSIPLLQRCLISVVGLIIAWGILFHRYVDIERWLGRLGAQAPLLSEMPRVNAWLGILCLMGLIAHEVYQQGSFGRVSMSPWLIVVVCILLLTIAASMVAAALSRIADPLRLPFARRESYVFMAEGALVLLFLHVRLTCPWLFGGVFQQYWPGILMVLAFALAGLAEWLGRRRLAVLAQPITQTAFVLPIIPAIAYAAADSQVPYAAVLGASALYYGLWAVLRASTPAMVLSMLSFCGTAWALLWDQQSLRIDQHPQLWLIPPAICMIAAAQFLRRRLAPQHAALLRYVGLLLAYAGSTGDILLVGVGKAPWLAGILALISVIGVFAGIVLKVRSFLYMGTGFLAIALLTLIYHATANLHQTWLMWLAGIGLGVGILLAFAMFERHKEKLLRVVEDLKEWER